MSQETKPVKIACELMWASLRRPSEMSGKYQVELCNLSPKAVAALEDIGIEARKDADKPDKGFFIAAKSKHPIKAYDTDGEEIVTSIGNGSKATVVIAPYEWTFKNKKGISASIRKLVVTELIEYQGGAADALDEEEAL